MTTAKQPVGPAVRGPGDGGGDGGGGSGGGGGGGLLRHSGGPWLRAAGGADGMYTHLGPVKAELEAAHEGLLAATDGLTAPAELAAVRESWTRRFEAARTECQELAGKLRAVARIHGETEQAVKSAFARMSVKGTDGADGADRAGRGVAR
ncbi:hypothetical protein ACFCV8_19020 [Streptomyces sp. NPDC056347]|uniref:hypothetical protein n=1 Tax=Streptomyces sp. NPDC056347 TaxID=3345790 RepID=UPI0035DB0507